MTTQAMKWVALVTEGTTGIGLATTQVLHETGFAVMVTAVDRS